MTVKKQFTPIATSMAGSSLTIENWLQIGVTSLAFTLEDLLMKPGINVLRQFQSLRAYSGWPGTIILDARLTSKDSTIYKIRSRFDGSIILLDPMEWKALIEHLNADEVILSEDNVPFSRFQIGNQPAANAVEGLIESKTGVFNILNESYREQYVPLCSDCNCVVCKGGYTRAYLHHLLQQVPLLAQRFLIQHNVYYYSQHGY